MIARVTLEIALRKEFDYLIPSEWSGEVRVGSRVKVPFGRREVLGCVTALLEKSERDNLRPIVRVIGAQSLITPKVLELVRWMAGYYCCAPETALRSVLPQAVRKEQAGWRERLVVRLVPDAREVPGLTRRQQELWVLLKRQGDGTMPLRELIETAGTTAGTVRRLEDRGLVVIQPEISERDPYANEQILPSKPLPLNPDQARCLEALVGALERKRTDSGKADGSKPSTFLLHGVTGSGKTEVYLQAIAETLRMGGGAIVLVPEISLTPQTVERFKARFCAGDLQTLVAVLHSHLSAGERHDEWHKIRQGRARIVIGARSAIFSPVESLGLIIVDEEHEGSYKQAEAPRYHARDIAVLRGRFEDAVVLLGSATPSMESYHNAHHGKYTLLEMPTRADDKTMPIVRVVDMRQAGRKEAEKKTPIFSEQLREALLQRLERHEQSMLFLNRRGYASSMQCPMCGYVAECPNCSVALTYHRRDQRLLCHICGHHRKAPSVCPDDSCRNPAIRFAGLGTERVEETLLKLFPSARVKRMDSDTLKRKEDYRRVLGDFRTGKIDILVGTQMIAKGLHFPNVTLVGIIHADLGLHMPDFRAGERTFQLLTQVSGRAGRGDVEGEVFVQSFTPFHPAIQYARRHDYEGFYDQEIEFRAQLKYPPIARIALLTLKGRNEDKVRLSADHLRGMLDRALSDWPQIIVAGPAPAPLLKAETFYRYQIMIRSGAMHRLSRVLTRVVDELSLPDDVSIAIDVDPVNMA